MLWVCALVLSVTALAGCANTKEPTTVAGWLDLGDEYLSDKNYDKAIDAFEKALELETKNIPARVGLGKAYWGSGRQDDAIKTLFEVLDIESGQKDAIRELLAFAQAYINKGNYEKAEALYLAILDKEKNHANVVDALNRLRLLMKAPGSPEETTPVTTPEPTETEEDPGDLNSELLERTRKNARSIAAGPVFTVGLRSDGTVVAVGSNEWGQCNVGNWRDMVAVATGYMHTVGLCSDGTVVAVGNNVYGECDTGDWQDIAAVTAGRYDTIGLCSDGTVVAKGRNDYGQIAVSVWHNIVALSAGERHTAGLCSDGTVVAVGANNWGQCDVNAWRDMVAISAGDWHTAGLRSDGTVVAVGENSWGQCDVSDWRDVVAVSAGSWHTVGLRSDGTVVAAGAQDPDPDDDFPVDYGQCDVSDWHNIVAVAAGAYHTVGLRSDGTVVAVGATDPIPDDAFPVNFGQCDVGDWKDIRVEKMDSSETGGTSKESKPGETTGETTGETNPGKE